jgi:hypothetical protein
MVTKFKSFEEFGKTVQQERAQKLKQQIDSIFEKSVRNDFHSIPEGPFKSKLPEIDWITFVRPRDTKTGEKRMDLLNVVIFSKTESGKNINHTWTLTKNGQMRPIEKIPPSLSKKYSQEEIALEIVSLLERISPSFIHLTNLDIIPFGDPGDPIFSGGKEGPGPIKPIDPEREKFLQSLRGAKFEFANRKNGFRGYKGLLFNKFIYLENLFKDNAAFIMDLPEVVGMEEVEKGLRAKKLEQGQSGEISKEELREAVLERYWGPISKKAKTRRQLIKLGAQRLIHTPGTWQRNILEAIESRMKN